MGQSSRYLAVHHPITEWFTSAIIYYSHELASGGSSADLGQAWLGWTGHAANWSEMILLHVASPLPAGQPAHIFMVEEARL